MTKATQLSRGEEAASRGRHAHLREITADEDAPLGTIGQELRGARISRGEDLAAVSRALKIRKDHLGALEDDNISGLPGRTYAIGFVRAYAAYLGLRAEDAVERFKTEIAGRDEVSKTAGFTEQPDEQRLSFGWILFAIVIVGLIAYGAYALFSGGGNSNTATIAPVPAQIVEKQSAPPNTSAARPPVARKSQIGSSALTSPEGQTYGAPAGASRVMLRTTGQTHILVQSESGNVLFNQILQPGEAYGVPNQPGLSLTAEHGNAVELVLDGKALGTAGQTAAAAEAMPLDPAVLAKRANAPTTPE
ncbi:MAG TPA: RodZ domain-containing protein [Rhizomicrobium sp.]|nr:RodZ domain-containing protein [Rhizomicrobium sp.]